MPTKRPDSTDLTVYVRKDLKRDFKLLCTAMDVSMSEVIGEFVEAWVEKNRDKLSRTAVNSEQPQSVAQIVQQNFWTLHEHNIKNIDAIAKGAAPTKADIVRISSILDLDQGELLRLAMSEFGELPKAKPKDKEPS